MFKDEVKPDSTCQDEDGAPIVALVPVEIEIKGVHFKVCNPGVAECKSIIYVINDSLLYRL